jgi:hypothetical protein
MFNALSAEPAHRTINSNLVVLESLEVEASNSRVTLYSRL